ncbi:MAG TPA: divalent-cation tolerance protein CutA [Candidatus Binataceae bacterium]|nr:divalent-cation tolerance protein CutA [Candidatus Binataceae bacterium]
MPQRSPRLRLVFTTASSEEQALSIARTIVTEQLAACVNIVGPMRSIYKWRDAIEDDREYLLLIKTRAAHYAKLEKRIGALHTYDVPEVISASIDRGSPPYVKWLLDSTAEPRRRRRKKRQ